MSYRPREQDCSTRPKKRIRKPPTGGVTKKDFHRILEKAAQPIEKPESGSGIS